MAALKLSECFFGIQYRVSVTLCSDLYSLACFHCIWFITQTKLYITPCVIWAGRSYSALVECISLASTTTTYEMFCSHDIRAFSLWTLLIGMCDWMRVRVPQPSLWALQYTYSHYIIVYAIYRKTSGHTIACVLYMCEYIGIPILHNASSSYDVKGRLETDNGSSFEESTSIYAYLFALHYTINIIYINTYRIICIRGYLFVANIVIQSFGKLERILT